jgi:hypothetical protein
MIVYDQHLYRLITHSDLSFGDASSSTVIIIVAVSIHITFSLQKNKTLGR